MRALLVLAVALVAAVVITPLATGRRRASPVVAIFYYPWYGTPSRDGHYEMWTQNDHSPPQDIYSSFFPERGVYSSSNPHVFDAQLAEIAGTGINEIIVSWWGRGSQTDARLPEIVRTASADGLKVAVHIEPYPGRTADSVVDDVRYLTAVGIHDVYVYNAETIPAADWAAARDAMPAVRLFAQTPHVGFAAAARFDGVYTYDIVGYPASIFKRYCDEAHAAGLICAPSVGPGYDAQKADGDPRVKLRRDGRTYDDMWIGALRAHPDEVTITSYNEWGEGTQIEPARRYPGYLSYDGAWGLHGVAAAYAYLDRTALWVQRLRSS